MRECMEYFVTSMISYTLTLYKKSISYMNFKARIRTIKFLAMNNSQIDEIRACTKC